MKLVTFSYNNEIKLGILHNDAVVKLEELGQKHNVTFPKTVLELIDSGDKIISQISEFLDNPNDNILASVSIPLSEVKLLAPIPVPRKNIIGIGLNYTEHIAESARTLDTSNELPQKPIIFSKPTTAVTATNTNVELNPKLTSQLDYECELAVIIGKKGKNISKEDAMNHVFGYTIINDISARDCRRAGQWIVSKGQDTFAPMGPCLVTKDEMSDPHNVNLSLTVNGVEKQNSNTRLMLFNIPALIEDLSMVFTLEPGDIIATGTPAGVGAGRNPQEWLKNGDVIEATIEGIGVLKNTVKEV